MMANPNARQDASDPTDDQGQGKRRQREITAILRATAKPPKVVVRRPWTSLNCDTTWKAWFISLEVAIIPFHPCRQGLHRIYPSPRSLPLPICPKVPSGNASCWSTARHRHLHRNGSSCGAGPMVSQLENDPQIGGFPARHGGKVDDYHGWYMVTIWWWLIMGIYGIFHIVMGVPLYH